jgi:hypothetical protein
VHTLTHPAPLKLPIDVDVILHPGEHRSKSTSLAAATISPSIHIHNYPAIPPELDPSTTLVLYPSPKSKLLTDLGDLTRYTRVLFVDSTWQQSKAISRDPRVESMTHVRIPQRESLFWRFQNNDPSYLATVEAIYYFIREYVTQIRGKSVDPQGDGYRGEVDDLLFYYINQFITIQQSYAGAQGTSEGPGGDSKKTFTTRHFAEYVLEGVSWDDVLDAHKLAGDAS